MRSNLARRMMMGGLFALSLTGQAAAQQPAQSRLLVPPDVQIAIMIKTSLIAFNHANLTGNYAVLRDIAAPSFREANSPARLAEIFRKPRKAKLDIAPIVLLQPKLVRKPWINKGNLLRLKGFFETRPNQVNFNLAFTAVGGQWRLFAIQVTTSKPKVAGKTPPKAEPVAKKPVAKKPAADPKPPPPKPQRAAEKPPASAPGREPPPPEAAPLIEPPKKKGGSTWWRFGN